MSGDPITPRDAAVHGHVLAAGKLAYLDTFAGLVPCKCLGVSPDAKTARVRITATRGAYKRGEVGSWPTGLTVVPRSAIRTVRGTFRISGTIVPVPS